MEDAKVRLDKYLWAIRIFKTRSQAADACEKGKVKLNGDALKASRIVRLNDQYEIKTETRKWLIEVTGIIQQRVAYSEAIKNYADLTPEEDLVAAKISSSAFSFNTGKRQSKQARPTKKERRNLDDFLAE